MMREPAGAGIEWMHDQSLIQTALILLNLFDDGHSIDVADYNMECNHEAVCIAQQLWAIREGKAPHPDLEGV